MRRDELIAAIGMPVLALLVVSAAGGITPDPGRADPATANRIAVWDQGHRLLDAGRNQEAAAAFLGALGERPGDLLALDGWLQAAARGDGAWARRPATAKSTAVHYCRADSLLAGWRLAAAAREFQIAAALASADGDSLAVSLASLRAAYCLSRDDRGGEARGALLRARGALPDPLAVPRLEGVCVVLAADLASLAGDFAAADSLYREFLPAARDRGWSTLTCDALNGLGATLSRRQRYTDAVVTFREGARLCESIGDGRRLAMVLNNLGYAEIQTRELAVARSDLQRARTLASAATDTLQLAYVQASLGALDEDAGNRAAAVERYREAAALHQIAGNRSGEASARQRLAYALLMLGEYRQAIAEYEACLDLAATANSPVGTNWVLGGLALASHKLGHLGRAAHWYRRALAVDEELGDRRGAAWCLNSLGLLDALRGDYREALLRHHHACELAEALGDTEVVGAAEVSIAGLHTLLGDHDRAFAHAARAFALGSASGREELLRDAASALAASCAATGRDSLAADYLDQSLALSRRWRDAEGVELALADLAEHHLAQGQDDLARREVAEAVSLLAPGEQLGLRARLLLLRGRGATDPSEAVGWLEQALTAARSSALPEREWTCLSELGAVRAALGDTASALACQFEAIEVIESLRRRAGSDELRRHMLRPAIVPYERAIDLLLGGGADRSRTVRALACAERARAQLLAGRLAAALAHVDQPRPTQSPAEEDLLARIGHRQQLLQDPGLGDDDRRALLEEIAHLEREHDLAVLQAAGVGPGEGPEPVDPGEDLLAVLRPQERVLVYVLGERRSWLITASGGMVAAYALPPRQEIEAKVWRFLQLWHESPTAGLPSEVLAASRAALHHLLLGPVARDLADDAVLVVVPDGLLHRLPFALLADDRGSLGERHEIFMAPSLASLRELRRREAGRQRQGPPDLDVLAVGHGGDDSARLLPFSGTPVTRLPHAAREARAVGGLFASAVVLTGEHADEQSFKAAPLDRCAVLHLAAHGCADDVEVRRSFLLLGPAPPHEDGLLQWHEVAALPLRASLVTLASCRSADGVLAVGEGVTGLTQAFLHAGATCVLAAQSDVPDQLSRQMMTTFYRGLREGRSASAALRAAQRQAIADAGSGDTGAWAGFVLVGDGGVTLAGGARADGRRSEFATGLLAVLAIACVTSLGMVSKRWRRT